MSEHPNPADFDDQDQWAAAVQQATISSLPMPYWAKSVDEPEHTEIEYAIEPHDGGSARAHTDELASAIEELPSYRDGARLITRQVLYGPWRYVIPEEITGD